MDELEKGFMDKMQVLENLIQSTKKNISQIPLLQYDNETKECNFSTRNNDTLAASRMSIDDALKMSINGRQSIVSQTDALSLPHIDRKNTERL